VLSTQAVKRVAWRTPSPVEDNDGVAMSDRGSHGSRVAVPGGRVGTRAAPRTLVTPRFDYECAGSCIALLTGLSDAGLVPLRCLIVDDHEPFLASAKRLLETADVRVVGVASTSADAVSLTEKLRPDVVLVDVDLGSESGFDLARALVARADPPRVALISTHTEDDLADLLAENPAFRFIPKAQLSPKAVLELG
jgi:CheY-like chemotaxis protein